VISCSLGELELAVELYLEVVMELEVVVEVHLEVVMELAVVVVVTLC